MKVSIESAAASYLSTANTGVKNQKSAPLQETGKKFDQVMINTNSRQIAEEKMEEAARKEVAAAVYQKTPDEKIARLKEQVSQGLYKVDPEAVAAKILLMGGQR